MLTDQDMTQVRTGRTWPRWIPRLRRNRAGGQNDRFGAQPDPGNGPRAIRHYARCWADHLAAGDDRRDQLGGSALRDGQPLEHGISYLLRLRPGTTAAAVMLQLPRIACALGLQPGQVVIERFPHTDPGVLRVILVTMPPAPSDFGEPQLVDGGVVLGRYVDGVGEALWRFESDKSWWGGLITGDEVPDACDQLLEHVGLAALSSGYTYVIPVDGDDGGSYPRLWKHAREHYGLDEVQHALARLSTMCQARSLVCQSQGRAGFTASRETPGVLVLVSKPDLVITEANVDAWTQIVREGRHVGLAVAVAAPDGTLATLKSQALRASLAAGNLVVLKSRGVNVFALGDGMAPPEHLDPRHGLAVGDRHARHVPFRLPLPCSRIPQRQLDGLPEELRVPGDGAPVDPLTAPDPGTALAADVVQP